MSRGGCQFETVKVNMNIIRELTKKAGYTGTQVCNIVGIGTSSYSNWTTRGVARKDSISRIAKLFNVTVEDLCVKDVNMNTELAVDSPTVVSGLKEIGDTQNIHEIFEIINSNIITLANMVEDIKHINAFEHAKIYEQMQKLMPKPELLLDKPIVINPPIKKEKPVAFNVNRETIEDLINGFNVKDSYDVYKRKVNRMVSIIATDKKTTHKQVLHDYYKEMNEVYGVVYEQLKKEYFNKYQHKEEGGSLELLYEEPIFREIFYNIISSKLVEIRKERVSI